MSANWERGVRVRAALSSRVYVRAQHEVKGLDPTSDLRPDVLITLPGRQILTDVAVVHSLAPGAVRQGDGTRSLGCARDRETRKRKKYTKMSSQRGFEQMPFVVETCGGVGPSADTLIKDMADASEEHLRMWSREAVIRQLVGSVAVSVQRGTAIAYLDGYEKTLRAIRKKAENHAHDDSEGEQEAERDDEDSEGGEESEHAVAA